MNNIKSMKEDMKNRDIVKMICDTSDFESLKNTILFSTENFYLDYNTHLKKYTDYKLDTNNDNNFYIDEFYADYGYEMSQIRKILIQSFFIKYVFLTEGVIKNIRKKFNAADNSQKVYKIVEKLDKELDLKISSMEDFKTFQILNKIRNSFAHGERSFESSSYEESKNGEITHEEIKKLKELDIIILESNSSGSRHWLKDDFQQFEKLHNFFTSFIVQIQKCLIDRMSYLKSDDKM